ncbi:MULTISPECIES: serine hydrolase domain-containing protein [Kordiimonas]|uniref:serine hydrolase domain-containing protein n=1 Tax=Kordiimonas TaxID=288021 RepID=UPI00257D1B37|nr:serine hydrolase domain-containing protein [Kordiimonas sp. UBA4487]
MRLIKYILLLCYGLHLATTGLRADGPDTLISKQALDAFLNDAEAKGFVGIVGISGPDGTIYGRGFGTTGNGAQVYSLETVNDIASITKQFTGAAILKLMEQGKLNLHDRLDRFFKTLPEDKKAITLHHLLTHTAGLPDTVGPDEEAIDRDTYLTRVFGTPLITEPGTRHAYSNTGYSLLAAVIEVASGQPYETYLFDNLWQPAGMFTTGYYRPDWRGRSFPALSEPHNGLTSAKDLLDQTAGKTWHLFGNGGILSSANDMLKWHRALISGRILSAGSKDFLMKPHVPEDDSNIYHYGYGWSIVPNFHGHKLVWHNGGSYFSRAEFWRFPDSGIGIFIATHDRSVEPFFIADGIAAVLDGRPPRPVQP